MQPHLSDAHTGPEADGTARSPAPDRVVLELRVRNHPGVLSHISGLFARRAFNLEGILCMPVAGAAESRMWLLVREEERLEQVEKQLRKLEDVRAVRHANADHAVFLELEAFFRGRDGTGS